MRQDLRWYSPQEYRSLNTKMAEDRVADDELTDVSNFTYDELGALTKIKGNESFVSSAKIQSYPLVNEGIDRQYNLLSYPPEVWTYDNNVELLGQYRFALKFPDSFFSGLVGADVIRASIELESVASGWYGKLYKHSVQYDSEQDIPFSYDSSSFASITNNIVNNRFEYDIPTSWIKDIINSGDILNTNKGFLAIADGSLSDPLPIGTFKSSKHKSHLSWSTLFNFSWSSGLGSWTVVDSSFIKNFLPGGPPFLVQGWQSGTPTASQYCSITRTDIATNYPLTFTIPFRGHCMTWVRNNPPAGNDNCWWEIQVGGVAVRLSFSVLNISNALPLLHVEFRDWNTSTSLKYYDVPLSNIFALNSKNLEIYVTNKSIQLKETTGIFDVVYHSDVDLPINANHIKFWYYGALYWNFLISGSSPIYERTSQVNVNSSLVLQFGTVLPTNEFPTLNVYTTSLVNGSVIAIHRWIDTDAKEWLLIVESTLGSPTDTLKVYDPVNNSFTTLRTNLTKNLQYTFADLLGRCYIANGSDPVFCVFKEESTGFVVYINMLNAPLGEYIIAAKNRLFISGRTQLNYSTGQAQFDGLGAVTGSGTTWSTNLRAGDLIGTGVSPTTFYIIKRVVSDTQLELTAAGVATGMTSYLAQKISDKLMYWSATQPFEDWTISGVIGGDTEGVILSELPITGLHNFDDAVLMMNTKGGDYITGIDSSNWTIPQHTRIPAGCVSHWSIVSKDGWLGFLSDKGYFVTKGGSFNFSDLGASPYSEMITTEFDLIDYNNRKKATSFVYKDLLMLAVPSTDFYSETDSQLSYSIGTVNVPGSSIVVTGIGTSWLGNIMPGDQIRFGAETDYYQILSVDSDTQITLSKLKTLAHVGNYVIRKARNNKILVLDSRTNIKKVSQGWTIFENVNANNFEYIDNKLLYSSSTNGYIYQYDIGGSLYGNPILSRAKTKRTDCGYPGIKKYFKACKSRAKGNGTIYITPIVDGNIYSQRLYYVLNSPNQIEEIYFPRADNPFSGLGYEIQYLIELEGQDEDVTLYPVETGFLVQPRE